MSFKKFTCLLYGNCLISRRKLCFSLNFFVFVFSFPMLFLRVGGYVSRWLLAACCCRFFGAIRCECCLYVVCYLNGCFLIKSIALFFPLFKCEYAHTHTPSPFFNLTWLFKLSKWSFFFVVLFHCTNIPFDFTGVCVCREVCHSLNFHNLTRNIASTVVWIVYLDVRVETASKYMSFFSLQLNKFNRKKMIWENEESNKFSRREKNGEGVWFGVGVGESEKVKMKKENKNNI